MTAAAAATLLMTDGFAPPADHVFATAEGSILVIGFCAVCLFVFLFVALRPPARKAKAGADEWGVW